MDDFDERVRQRAYRLWVEEGCPEGRSDAHWEKARELVAIEDHQVGSAAAQRGGEPVDAARKAGELTPTDHGEQAKRRVAAASPRVETKRKAPAAPKAPKEAGSKRR